VKRFLLVTAALVAAVILYGLIARPAKPILLATPWQDGSVAGAIHVHSDRSDGSSSPEVIAAAAARAGLAFVIFTDHGDGTRAPDPPAYRDGVLCLDGVEISTDGGHYVAIDMPQAPYPLAGEPRDVVDDVRRLGGFGVAAHPDSPKRELHWEGWTAPYDGIELINPDSSWRAHAVSPQWSMKFGLARALITYPFRGAETIAGLLKDSPEIVNQWNEATSGRRVVGLAGDDAHARLDLLNGDPGESRFSLPIPSYEASFRVLSVHIHPDRPLTGDAAADAQSLVGGLRNGRLYTTIDGWATPPAFEFTARNSRGTATGGGELAVGGPVTFHLRSNAPASFTTTLWKGNEAVASGRGDQDLEWTGPEDAAVYRAEIRADGHAGGPPWIISNPIYLRGAGPLAAVAEAPKPTIARPLFDGRTPNVWTNEADATSLAMIEVVPRIEGSELRLRFGLSGGADTGQFAATAVATPDGVASYDRVSFTIRAEQPMRVSVQLRAPIEGGEPQRWQRSIYVTAEDTARTILFSDLSPVGPVTPAAIPLSAVRDVLFVVDTVNTQPGASARVWLRDVRLEK
jgi:hypothetical protein